ncbi:MAG: Bax inhibitor-1 family protein [Clostridia bacterium]|nr:Bax inhibitor-1 family protein [Clostridia bacterium]
MNDFNEEQQRYERDTVYVDTSSEIINNGELSHSTYNLIIGLTLFWGFFVNIILLKTCPLLPLQIGEIPFIIGYFILCISGILMTKLSKKPLISFIGYNMVVVPMGLALNMCLLSYSPDAIFRAVTITGLVTLCMMALSYVFPKVFAHLGKALGIMLLITIFVELGSMFFFPQAHAFLDYVVIFIFCGYIGYDWYVANQLEKTLDNAIDSACNIYVDIINLLIRILARSNDD